MTTSCLVIGGGGFIGRRTVAQLLDSGREVLVMGRGAESPALLDPRASYRSGDYGDAAVIGELLARMDEVIDLAYATVPKSSFDDPVFDLDQNVRPAVTLLQAAMRSTRLRKLVFVSSGGTVYGHALRTPIDESHPTDPVSPYGITKLAIEKYALMFHRLYGVPVTIVRPGNAYGEGQLPFRGQGLVATAIASIRTARPLTLHGGREIVRDYIHVDDVAAAIVAALDGGIPGACYNAGTGVGTTSSDVVEAIVALAAAEGLRAQWSEAPTRPFDVRLNMLDAGLLIATTGWRPVVPLHEGLDRAWRSTGLAGQQVP